MTAGLPAAPTELGGTKIVFLVYDSGNGANGAAAFRAVAQTTVNNAVVASMSVGTHADGANFLPNDPTLLIAGYDGTYVRKALMDASGRLAIRPLLVYDSSGNPAYATQKAIKQAALDGVPAAFAAVATNANGDTFGSTDPVLVIAGVNGSNAVTRLAIDANGRVTTAWEPVFAGQGHMNVTGGVRQALKSSTACRLVRIKADKGNAATLYWGGAGVTADETAATGGYQLEPGDSSGDIWTPNVSNIYIHGTNNDGASFVYYT